MIGADRRLADRRHQDDEVGDEGDGVRLLVARRSTAIALYQIDNGVDAARLRRRERQGAVGASRSAPAQKAPPVMADGKIYVGTENGKFFIVRPQADRAEILSDVELPDQHQQLLRIRRARPSRSCGRRHLARPHLLRVERRGLRHRPAGAEDARPGSPSTSRPSSGDGAPAYVQVSPTELVLAAGPDRQAARAALRRQGPVPPRRASGHLVARRPEGHRRRRRVHRRPRTRSNRPALIKADGRRR